MTFTNTLKVDFSSGSLDPSLHGRSDLPLYAKGLEDSLNFVTSVTGPCTYRSGFRTVQTTRRNKQAWFIPFQYNDEQSYLIEATDGYFRFYKDEAIITLAGQSITGVTNTNPAVLTYSGSDDYANGDEVIVTGVLGMTELNNRSFIVTNVNTAANTFELYDFKGDPLNASFYGTYSSGGTISKIYEIQVPYEEAYLKELQFTQNANTMYINHRRYEPRQLTRSAHTSWALARYSRTNDPFQTAQAITGITQANPAVVTYTGADSFTNGAQIYIDSVVGMTQVNNQHYLVANVNTVANTFELKTLDGVNVNSTTYTAWSSGGFVELIAGTDYPRTVAFTDDTRVVHGGTVDNPETLWFSRGPSAGVTRFTDFTTGSADTDATTFTLAPIHGRADVIQWLTYSDKFLLVGTFGTIRRIYGATQEDSITPTSITAKSSNVHGTKISRPAVSGPLSFYIQRGGRQIRSYEYDYQIDGFYPVDRNLLNNRILEQQALRLADQRAQQDYLWVALGNGRWAGHTYNAKENKAAWHGHKLGGPYGKVLDVGVMPRVDEHDQLWIVAERTLDSGVVRTVEFQEDEPRYVQRTDFYNDPDNEDTDTTAFLNAVYEQQKHGFHLDGGVSYDGFSYSDTVTMTPGAGADTLGSTGVTFTASSAVFDATMVGRQIWKKYDTDGTGGGRALITGYTSTTEVTCTIEEAFDSVEVIPVTEWALTATTVYGLWLWEGETVDIFRDGSHVGTDVVENGSVSLSTPGSVIHVGFKYLGYIKSVALDQGGVSGPAVNKIKNIAKVVLRVLNTATGFEVGTSFYRLESVNLRISDGITSRPVPLRTGLAEQTYEDDWNADKHIYIVQRTPAPCTILSLDGYTSTSDDGG